MQVFGSCYLCRQCWQFLCLEYLVVNVLQSQLMSLQKSSTDSLAAPDTYQPIDSSLLILSKRSSHLVTPPPQAKYPHTGFKYPNVLPTIQARARTNCAEREERKEQRWETAKWLGLPGRNVLIEVYRSSADPAEHKKTSHYQTWRDTVTEMMAEPRSSVKYDNLLPNDGGWG